MNKQQVIAKLHKHLSNRGANYQKWEINEILEPFLALILEELEQGKNITLANFGKFTVKIHKSRLYYNINKGQMEHTSEKRSIVFTPYRNVHKSADPE